MKFRLRSTIHFFFFFPLVRRPTPVPGNTRIQSVRDTIERGSRSRPLSFFRVAFATSREGDVGIEGVIAITRDSSSRSQSRLPRSCGRVSQPDVTRRSVNSALSSARSQRRNFAGKRNQVRIAPLRPNVYHYRRNATANRDEKPKATRKLVIVSR